MLLVKSAGPGSISQWRAEFARHLPNLDVRWWDEPGIDPAAIRYVLVWQPTAGRLVTFPNLEVIFSSGAGVEHIVQDASCPTHVPVVRMGADELSETMAEFIAMAALMVLRDQPRMVREQGKRNWAYFEPQRTARESRVGILGIGAMGIRAGRVLRMLGFDVTGWSRTPKSVDGLTCLHGPDGLQTILATSHILVSLLPETPQTRHLIDRHAMQAMPRGASIINVGRGSAIVLDDLLAALRAEHIAYALLDVLDDEPPKADHPAWSHERLLLTPHVAGYARIPAKAAYVAAAIRAHSEHRPLPNVYDRARGY